MVKLFNDLLEKFKSKNYFLKISLLALAGSYPAILFHSKGTNDVNIWMSWINNTQTNGFRNGYRNLPADYPPGAQFILQFTSHFGSTYSDYVKLKLLLLISIIIVSILFYLWFQDLNAATATVIVFTLSSIGLVYLDIFWGIPFVLAFWMIQKNKLFFGGIFYGLSVMIKWQPLIVLPFILIYLIKTPELELIRKKALNIKSFLLGFSILPIFTILYIGWQPILLSLARALNHKFLSGNALNLPWILGLLDTSQFYGSQEIKYLMQNQVHMYVLILCRVIFLLSWILLLKRYWFSLRTYEDLILSSVLGTIFYFSFNLGVHENHLFIAAILSLMGFWIIPNQRLTFFTIILMSELNLILFYGLTGKALASRNFIGVDLSIPLSMVFIFALIGISIDLVSSMSKKV